LNPKNSSNRGSFPDNIAKMVSARNEQRPFIEVTHHFTGRFQAKKGGKNQFQALLHFLIGVLNYLFQTVADQPDWQLESQVTSFSFVEQASRHPGTNGMELKLRQLAFESQQHPSIQRRRIVNVMVVSDETTTITTDIE